jgi:hypothetical protein
MAHLIIKEIPFRFDPILRDLMKASAKDPQILSQYLEGKNVSQAIKPPKKKELTAKERRALASNYMPIKKTTISFDNKSN